MHVALITAGGAGMFCGSCMHDNTWARALRAEGVNVSLLPTYTPIRVDEEDVSAHRVFLGGLNVYLDYRFPVWRKLPRGLTRWLDAPWLISLASRLSERNDARKLGPLTISLLEGERGPAQREIREMADFVAQTLRPDVICFSNALLVGALRTLRDEFAGKIFCTLQGDDIFLEALPEPYRSEALQRIAERAQQFDGFLVHSRYYQEFMSSYLRQPVERFRRIPLGIELEGCDGQPAADKNPQFTIGYFARVCPEKGVHQLIRAFEMVAREEASARLVIGGYLAARDRRWFQKLVREVRSLGERVVYVGSPDSRSEKLALMRSFDVLCVPTVYREPKGLYVLEALANGVPVVVPAHGAFPELIEATGGGLLVPPGDCVGLAHALLQLARDPDRRVELARTGRATVHSRFDARIMARATKDIFAGADALQPDSPRAAPSH